MNETTTLKSGRVLMLGLAPFSVGTKLFKQVLAELRTVDLDVGKIDLNLEINLAKMDPKMLNGIKNVVCEIASSDQVEATLFECMARCTIDGKKIDRNTFEAADTRPDYLPAAWEVIRFNLAPFFSGLDLSSLTNAKPSAPAPE
jgi:hypothetical protein